MRHLILGASRGIGLACLIKLTSDKRDLCYALSRCPPAKTNARIEGRFEHIAYDLEKPNDLLNLRNLVRSEKLTDWSVVFSIGTQHKTEDTTEEFERLKLIYFVTPKKVIDMVMRYHPKQSHTFVVIGSSAVWHRKANKAYVEAKEKLHRFVEEEGGEYAKRGSLLCGVAPAAVSGYDNRWDRCKRQKPDVWSKVAKEQAMGRFQTPDEIAEKIAWIIKERPKGLAGKIINMDANVG
ncbi:MAG: SDR family oxidoreductase [Opitutales bacterium]|nr:SDR family oxidoreductase [Opitutales bacterium]